jgi:Uma2 family endonuclease
VLRAVRTVRNTHGVSVPSWPDHLLTFDEWLDLPEGAGRRFELVEGVLLVSPGPISRHQRALWRLAAQLEPWLSDEWGVLTESELIIDFGPPATVRVPDLLVVPAEAIDEDRSRWAASEVRLAVEVVSPGTSRTDHVMKCAEYAEIGIPYYWIVDLDEPVRISTLRLSEGEYVSFGERSGRVAVDFDGSRVPLDLPALLSGRTGNS